MEQTEFETLIQRIRPRLHHEALCQQLDNDEAEDVTQETVLKLWVMRQELGHFRSVEALAVVMVRRIVLTRKRKKSIPLADWREVEIQEHDTPETIVINQEEESRLLRLLSKLPDAQQAVLRMKHIDGLETSEIARITGSSEESVRQNLSRARRKIMQMFIK